MPENSATPIGGGIHFCLDKPPKIVIISITEAVAGGL